MIHMTNMFPNELFEDIEKKDGYIALIFYMADVLLIIINTYIFRDLLRSNKLSAELRQLISGSVFYLMSLLLILIITRIRNQKLYTIGIRRKGLTFSIGIGLALSVIVFLIHIFNGRDMDAALYEFIFYVVILGFSEEIAFRGFIWPRLAVLFGRKYGTILSGIMFGIMHAPFKIIMYEAPVFSSIFNEIGGGVIASIVFIFIYTRNKNIVLPSMIHGILDYAGRI